MITFKNEVLFINEISILEIIEKDFSVDFKSENNKKAVKLFENFSGKLMENFFENLSDEIQDRVIEITDDSTNDYEKRIKLLQLIVSHPEIEKIYNKSYYEFKRDILLHKGIESYENIDVTKEGVVDIITESTSANNIASASIGILSIFFSKKYRMMSDDDIKLSIKRDVFKLVFGLILTSLVFYLIFKYLF